MRSTLVIRKHGQGFIATANNFPGGVSGARIGLTVEEAAIRTAELMAQVASNNCEGGDLVAPAEILERVPKHLHAVAAVGLPISVEVRELQTTQIASLHADDFVPFPRKGERLKAKDGRVYVVDAIESVIGHRQGAPADHIRLITIVVVPFRIPLERSKGDRLAPQVGESGTVVLEGPNVSGPDYVCWSCNATLVRGLDGFSITNADTIECAACHAYNAATSSPDRHRSNA